MTTAPPVHITIVLDRSGSMQAIADDVVGGFNAFLAEQRDHPSPARVTLVQFDSHGYDVLIEGADIAGVPDLDPAAYRPRGATPLYDAVGRTIGSIDREIASRADHDLEHEDQVVAIITDGLENASIRFRRNQVFAMIEERTERGWTFVFLGANQDSYAEGGAIGMQHANIKDFAADADGVKTMFNDLSTKHLAFRSASTKARSSMKKSFLQDADSEGR